MSKKAHLRLLEAATESMAERRRLVSLNRAVVT